MDTAALLKSQGWRGHGHTLHATDDSTGLAKPLLLARKDNKLGIGTKEHKSTSDQWWLNAFDQQLAGLDTSKQGQVVQTVTHGKLNQVVQGQGKYKGAAGLYASFVSGGLLQGTIEESLKEEMKEEDATTPEAEELPMMVRAKKETKEEKRVRREARRIRKEAKAARKAGLLVETKEERRARREAKRERRAAKAARGG